MAKKPIRLVVDIESRNSEYILISGLSQQLPNRTIVPSERSAAKTIHPTSFLWSQSNAKFANIIVLLLIWFCFNHFHVWLLVSKLVNVSKRRLARTSYCTSFRSNFYKDIWTATYQAEPTRRSPTSLTLSSTSHLEKVIVKVPPKYHLDHERDILQHFYTRPGIRQLLDETNYPPYLPAGQGGKTGA